MKGRIAMLERAKRRVGRPPGRKAPIRPTVAARVPEEDYAKLKEDARIAKRTLAEQVFFRWRQADEWEKAFGSIRELQAKAREIIKQNLQAALKEAGYQQVRGVGGSAWLEPGLDPANWTAKFDPEVLEKLLDDAAERGAKRALESMQSWTRAAKTTLEEGEGS
jgi:hypothetical protein